MSHRQKPKKRRGTTAATVLCFVAAITIAGTYSFRNYKEQQREDELAQAEELKKAQEELEEQEEASEEASTGAQKFVIRDEAEAETEKKDPAAGEPDAGTAGERAPDASAGGGQDEAAPSRQTATKPQMAHFNEDSMLLWPVEGNIILGYSMDKTVYFATLEQYKYNPALIIAGAEGDQVLCGAPGVVKSIDVTAQTGTTVNVDIGNGYELFYGQLKEVPVKVGDFVEAKSVLGYVSQPTKYYSVEGCNVYFEMRKNGQPVNPMEYLTE